VLENGGLLSAAVDTPLEDLRCSINFASLPTGVERLGGTAARYGYARTNRRKISVQR
jgi:hypothetical protein